MYEFKRRDGFDFADFLGITSKEKGNELFFKQCPYCGANTHDKNTFSINLDTGAFNCFRSTCSKKGHFVELARDFNYPLEDESQKVFRALPQRKPEPKEKSIEYLATRGISEKIAKKYHITSHKKDENVLVFPFYDENGIMQFVKYRNTKYDGRGSKEWCEKDTKPILFGMYQCESFDTLIITEGQMDSLSICECGLDNCVSVPTGANGFTWLTHCWDWINKFKKIIVFGDYEKGKITLLDKLRNTLRMPVYSIRPKDYLCEKDANAILQKFGKEAILTAIKNAEIQELKYVKRLSAIKNQNVSELPKIKTNIRKLDRVLGGLLLGHVMLLSGKRGEGKSTFMSQLIAEAIEQNNAVFIYSGELPAYHFKNWLNLQIAGNNHIETKINEYGDQESFISTEVSEKINKWYHDKAFIFDNTSINDDEYVGLVEVIIDAIGRYDLKLICIDNLMTAIEGDPKTDIYRLQSEFVKKLEKIAQQYNVAIILVAHPKKTIGDFNNDSVSGSSDITNAVSCVVNYERAKKDDDWDSYISVTKNRMGGRLLIGENKIKMYYDIRTKRVLENILVNKEYSCFKEDGFAEVSFEDLPFE